MASRTNPTLTEYSVENLTRGLMLAARVRLATDSSERRRGLLGVSELAPGAGLWLNPCEAVHTFGMRISIDAFFLDSTYQIRKIAPCLKPGRIAFCVRATSTLELSAGVSALTGTQKGDQLSFKKIVCRVEDQPGR